MQQRFGVAGTVRQRERVGETRETRNIINDARRKRRGRETPHVFDGTDAKGNSATVGELFERGLEERTRKELLLARDENGVVVCITRAGASPESMKCLEMVLLECERRGERLDMAVKDFVDGLRR